MFISKKNQMIFKETLKLSFGHIATMDHKLYFILHINP